MKAKEIADAIKTLQQAIKESPKMPGSTIHITEDEVSLDDSDSGVVVNQGMANEVAEELA